MLMVIFGKKEEKKKDNKGIREIKKFIRELYIKLENIIKNINNIILEWNILGMLI